MQLATLHEDNNGLQVTPWVYSDEYPNTQVLQMAALLHEKQFEINELHKLQVPSIRKEFDAHCSHYSLFVIAFKPHLRQLGVTVKHETHALFTRI